MHSPLLAHYFSSFFQWQFYWLRPSIKCNVSLEKKHPESRPEKCKRQEFHYPLWIWNKKVKMTVVIWKVVGWRIPSLKELTVRKSRSPVITLVEMKWNEDLKSWTFFLSFPIDNSKPVLLNNFIGYIRVSSTCILTEIIKHKGVGMNIGGWPYSGIPLPSPYKKF